MSVTLLTLPALPPTGFSVRSLWALADSSDPFQDSRFAFHSSRIVTYVQVQRWRHSRTGVFFKVTIYMNVSSANCLPVFGIGLSRSLPRARKFRHDAISDSLILLSLRVTRKESRQTGAFPSTWEKIALEFEAWNRKTVSLISRERNIPDNFLPRVQTIVCLFKFF